MSSYTEYSDSQNLNEAVVWTVEHPNVLVARGTSLMSPHISYMLAVVPEEESNAGNSPLGTPKNSNNTSKKKKEFVCDPNDALFTGKMGRLNPSTSQVIEHFVFDQVLPLCRYHVGYMENDLWHWTTVEIPLEVVPGATSPKGFSVHINHSDHPDIVGVKLLVTNEIGFRSEREYPLDMLEIHPDTGFQVVTLRHLTTCTAFTVTAWPLFKGQEEVDEEKSSSYYKKPVLAKEKDGEEGAGAESDEDNEHTRTTGRSNERRIISGGAAEDELPWVSGKQSLSVKLCTLPEVAMTMHEVGETYLRFSIRRATWNGPVNRGVTPEDARIEHYRVECWEDPRGSLKQNAIRLSAGRMPQRYPLERRCVEGFNVAVGEHVHFLMEGLNPETPHFLMLRHRTDTFLFNEPVRCLVRTAPECTLQPYVRAGISTLQVGWNRPMHDTLPHYGSDVWFPEAVNLFTDRDVVRPYVGPKQQVLDEGTQWQTIPTPSLKEAEAVLSHYEVCITNAETRLSKIVKVTPEQIRQHLVRAKAREKEARNGEEESEQVTEEEEQPKTEPTAEELQSEFLLAPSASLSYGLEPCNVYAVKLRSALHQQLVGRQSNPWSREHLLVTPSEVICRVVSRTRTSLELVWGRFLPPLPTPLERAPGRARYLPDIYVEEEEERQKQKKLAQDRAQAQADSLVAEASLTNSKSSASKSQFGRCHSKSQLRARQNAAAAADKDVEAEAPFTPLVANTIAFVTPLTRAGGTVAGGPAAGDEDASETVQAPATTGTSAVESFYYYLESLPYLHGPQVEDAVLSESDDEEEVYEQDTLVGDQKPRLTKAQQLYAGRRPRIVNRVPRVLPSAEMNLPTIVDHPAQVSLMLIKGHHRETACERIAEVNYLEVDIEEEYAARYNPVWRHKGTDTFSSAVVEDLEPGQEYTVYVFTRVYGNGNTKPATEEEAAADPVFSSSARKTQCFTTFTLQADGVLITGEKPVVPAEAATQDQSENEGTLTKMARTLPQVTKALDPRSQLLWSSYCLELFQDMKATKTRVDLEVKELSEVFVTLELAIVKEGGQPSIRTTFLEAAATACTYGAVRANTVVNKQQVGYVEDAEKSGELCHYLQDPLQQLRDPGCDLDEASLEDLGHAVPREYLVRVVHTTSTPDSSGWMTVGEPHLVYYATSETRIQVVGLKAAVRYEVSIAVLDNQTQRWCPWSVPVPISTVERLQTDIVEVSTEYVSIQWGRAKTDNILDYQLVLQPGHMLPNSTETDRTEETGPPTQRVTYTTQRTCLSIFDTLAHNTLYDCSVIPRYRNLQVGLASNAVRFIHCIVDASIVECGVDHLLLNWENIDTVAAFTPPCLQEMITSPLAQANGHYLVRLRQGDSWERTISVPLQRQADAAGTCLFTQLSPLSSYVANVSLVGTLPRCICHPTPCCGPPNPRKAVACSSAPFSLAGRTLTQPTAHVTKLGESCVELEWEFYTEAAHEGQITMEVKFVDNQRGESFQVFAKCETSKGLTEGTGKATIEGLLPERLYVVEMRQQYSRGTWGDWQRVLEGVSTLRCITVAATHVGETFFHLEASRPPWTQREGTHASMADAEEINPPLWKYSVTNILDNQVLEIEADTPTKVIENLLPNNPYTLSVQQYSMEGWGEPSPPLHLYTLQPMFPVVITRSDNYLRLGCSRDRRLPAVSTPLCKPHDASTSVVYSSLRQVHLTATSLLDPDATPVRIQVDCSEADAETMSALVTGLLPSHPYQVDMVTRWEEAQVHSPVQSLASITLGIPELHLIDRGEDTVTVTWQKRLAAGAQHYASFQNLPSNVRHAAKEGKAATIRNWHIRAQPVAVAVAAAAAQAAQDLANSRRAETPLHGIASTLESSLTRKESRGARMKRLQEEQKEASALAQAEDVAEKLAVAAETAKAKRPFQEDVEDVIIEVEDGATTATISKLMPETEYTLSMRSVDENDHKGWFVKCADLKTARFTTVSVNKLAENFCELSWEDAAGGRQSMLPPALGGLGASGISRDRGKSMSRSTSSPGSPLSGTKNANDFGRKSVAATTSPTLTHQYGGKATASAFDKVVNKQPSYFEVYVFQIDSPTDGRLERVPFTEYTVLLENLSPRTKYGVICRAVRTIPPHQAKTSGDGGANSDEMAEEAGTEVQGSWGAMVQFETLALLVLRVVAVSLDFATVAWGGAKIKAMQNEGDSNDTSLVSGSPSPTKVIEGGPQATAMTTPSAAPEKLKKKASAIMVPLPKVLEGSPTFFCVLTRGLSGSAEGTEEGESNSAAAVRFQLRVVDALPDGTPTDRLKEDMYVTEPDDEGVYAIRNLTPKTSYAISMRVCYVGVSGSWVEPAVITTDHVPEPKVHAITQSSGEFFYRIQKATLQPRVSEPLPERRHRHFEVLVREESVVQDSIVDNETPAALRVKGLKRDHYYHVLLRELIRGRAYGDWSPLTTFWTQPYPPSVTELVECHDDVCEIHWGVMNNDRVGEILEMDRCPEGFVYSLEKGLREPPGGGSFDHKWEEVAITDVPYLRFHWRTPLHGAKTIGSPLASPRDGGADPNAEGGAGSGILATTSTALVPATKGTCLSKLCFRVRLSKLFVSEPGKDYKVPVWGDYSETAYWKDPTPPTTVRALKLAYINTNQVVVQWELPENYQTQPNLSFLVSIDAGRATAQNTDSTTSASQDTSDWFKVATVRELHTVIKHLKPNSHYRVAVRGRSNFGWQEKSTTIAFTTRAVPNSQPVPKFPKVDWKKLDIKGLAPHRAALEPAGNLFDKYDIPQKRRLKALSALAGIQPKSRRPRTLVNKLKRTCTKGLIVTAKLKELSVNRITEKWYNPNEPLTPWQWARQRCGMDPYKEVLVWSDKYFEFDQHLLEQFSAGGGAEKSMAIMIGATADSPQSTSIRESKSLKERPKSGEVLSWSNEGSRRAGTRTPPVDINSSSTTKGGNASARIADNGEEATKESIKEFDALMGEPSTNMPDSSQSQNPLGMLDVGTAHEHVESEDGATPIEATRPTALEISLKGSSTNTEGPNTVSSNQPNSDQPKVLPHTRKLGTPEPSAGMQKQVNFNRDTTRPVGTPSSLGVSSGQTTPSPSAPGSRAGTTTLLSPMGLPTHGPLSNRNSKALGKTPKTKEQPQLALVTPKCAVDPLPPISTSYRTQLTTQLGGLKKPRAATQLLHLKPAEDNGAPSDPMARTKLGNSDSNNTAGDLPSAVEGGDDRAKTPTDATSSTRVVVPQQAATVGADGPRGKSTVGAKRKFGLFPQLKRGVAKPSGDQPRSASSLL